MRTLFNFAMKQGSISINPMLTLRLEHKHKKYKRDLSDSEIDLILKYASKRDLDGKFHLMLCTLIYIGIRVGELCGLRWNDFSDDFSTIKIDESITDKKFENSTKTKYSERILPLNVYLQQKYRERFLIAKEKDDFSLSDYVFLNRFGSCYTSISVNKRLRYIKQLIYEEEGVDVSEITAHYFRHTFATRGLRNGVAVQEMQELLGHANSRTLLEVYTHTNPERKSDSIDTISNSFNLNNVSANMVLQIIIIKLLFAKNGSNMGQNKLQSQKSGQNSDPKS